MQDDAIYRAHFHALRGVVMTHAFRALVRRYFVDFLALVYRVIRAFRLAYVAVDTFVGNE